MIDALKNRVIRKLQGPIAPYTIRSFDQMSAILSWILDLSDETTGSLDFNGKSILEIGTGNYLNHPISFKVLGADRVLTIDKFHHLSLEQSQSSLSQNALCRRYFSKRITEDQFRERFTPFMAEPLSLNRLQDLGIEYWAPFDLLEDRLDQKFDVVFSYTVLEHLSESMLADFLRASLVPMKPGGIAIHLIDLEDHKRPGNQPFEFLGDSREWSESLCAERGNRVRASSYGRIFSEMKDECKWTCAYQSVRFDPERPSSIRPEVQHVDERDLRTTTLLYVGEKIK